MKAHGAEAHHIKVFVTKYPSRPILQLAEESTEKCTGGAPASGLTPSTSDLPARVWRTSHSHPSLLAEKCGEQGVLADGFAEVASSA